MKTTSLHLSIFDNKSYVDPATFHLKNKIYDMWSDGWGQTYASQGSDHRPSADDFFRYDLLVALTHDDEVIGCSAHSFLNLKDKSAMDVNFFKTYTEKFRSVLETEGLLNLMTIEAVLIAPKYRVNELKLSLGKLLMRASSELLGETSAQALVAIARKDNKVSEFAQHIGYSVVHGDLPCRGFPCDLIVLPQGCGRAIQNAQEEGLVRNLWDKRTIVTGNNFYRLAPVERKLKIAV